MTDTDRSVQRDDLRTLAPALILVDLDNFKRINTEYGHAGGDQALVAVAGALIEATRPGDCIARIGGDEFAIIAPHAGERGARFLAERCAEAIRATSVSMQLKGCQFSSSVGYALYPFHGQTIDDLVQAADSALRRIKAHGKDDIASARTLASA